MRPHSLPVNACAAALTGAALLMSVAIERARAGGLELAQSIGEPLLAYAGATHDQGLRTLVINGARLRMRTGSTPDSIDTVLDSHLAACRSSGAAPEPAVRTRRADQGFIGCIVPNTSVPFLERLRALDETQDLAALGELRFAWAMRSAAGTRYVTIASEGELRLPVMFPGDRDSPGIDPPHLPRPPDARRLITSWQEGQAPMLVSYRSERALTDVVDRYTAALWAASLRVELVPSRVDGERALLIRDGARQTLAILAADRDGTLISIIPVSEDATELAGAR
jgi:hypothetical protein